MELTVHITYFPMEDQYGTSLWRGDTMIDIDYQLHDSKKEAQKAGKLLRKEYIRLTKEEI